MRCKKNLTVRALAYSLGGGMNAEIKSKYSTLREMYGSREFEAYISDKLGNDLFINDPERADRIDEAAQDGADGSTHAEHIDDWREFLRNLRPIDAEYPEDGGDITDEDYTTIEAEIDACEAWHQANGSLEQQIG